MCFLKNPKFDPLEARTSGFTGSMGGKRVAGVVFGPKPTPDPNFIKIGVGHRTRPYIRLLHFLTSGLLIFHTAAAAVTNARLALFLGRRTQSEESLGNTAAVAADYPWR